MRSARRPVDPVLLTLMTTTALVGVLSPVAFAQSVTIDGGTTETVIGSGGGTQASPWLIFEELYVGDVGVGALHISVGGSVENGLAGNEYAYIGGSSTGDGTVTVDGTGSDWISHGQIWVGYDGTGTLTISDGASVTDTTGNIAFGTASTGTVVVTGPGSSWENANGLYVSEGGTGYLTVSNGGSVSVTPPSGAIRIANDAGAYGEATVTGTGSSLSVTDGDLFVGYAGTGVLNIMDTATVTADDVFIAHEETGVGTVNIETGGTLDVSASGSNLTIGRWSGSQGTLNIADGLADVGNETVLGDSAGSQGTIAITSAAGQLQTRHLSVGDAGTGTLNVTGGQVTVNSLMTVGVQTGANGTVIIDGGTIAVGMDLTVGESGTGNVTVQNTGGLNITDELILGEDTGSSGTVTVDNSTVDAAIFRIGNNGGTGTLTAQAGATLTVGDVVLADDATATGTLHMTGTGTDLDVGGDLQVGVNGTGTMNIEGGATAAVTNDVILGFNATGNGTLTVDGAGSELDVTDAFVVGRAGTGVLTVQNGGTLTGNYSYVGNSSGATGTATITGSGSSWTLTGDLYIAEQGTGAMSIADGGTVSNAVSYIGYDSGSVGTVTVTGAGSTWTNNSTLYVGEDGDGTLTISDSGTVSAVGGVEIASASGSSVINIGAAEGDAAAAAGTLDTSGVVFGSGNGELVFNHTNTAYDFDAAISGLGSIEHFAGVTNLTADNSGFTGETVVSGGSLYVNDSLGGTVYVDGGTLGGSGTAGALTVNFGGNLAPGNSIGTLNVASATFAVGSTYTIELNDGGFVAGTNSDLLNASGTVTINGGTVHVTPENGTDDGSTYTPGTYTIVTAGSVTGTFDAVTDDFVFLDFTDSYDATNVYLTSEQAAFFSDIAQMPNQMAIAPVLESLGSGNAVYDALIGLVGDEDDARVALDSLTGEIHASARTVLLEDSRFSREAAMNRLRMALGSVGADSGAQIENRISGSFGLWGQGFGSWSRRNSDGNAATMDRTIGGFLMGGDALVWGNARFGVFGGYSRSNFSVDDRMSSGAVDSYTLGVYGGGEQDAFTLSGGLAHSWQSLDTSRSVAFGGFSDSLSASYSARTLQAWGEAAVSFETDTARFEPFANLAYVNLNTDGFTETGGAAALTVASNDVNATFATLGLRAETDVALGNMGATLHGMVGWRHAFGDTPTSLMTFASGGNAFTIAGAPLAQDSLVLDAGFDVNLTGNATLGLAYGGQFGSGVQGHSAKLNLNVRF